MQCLWLICIWVVKGHLLRSPFASYALTWIYLERAMQTAAQMCFRHSTVTCLQLLQLQQILQLLQLQLQSRVD